MPALNDEGKAYIAPWIIKLVAAAGIGVLLTWAGSTATTNSIQDVKLAVLSSELEGTKEKLTRIETKLDLALVQGRQPDVRKSD